MAETTSRMAWPFPSAEENPWFDRFSDMVGQMDQSAYASRSDRHIILAEGGTVDWTAPNLSWTDTLVMTAPITGFQWQLLATSVQLDTDGQVLYVVLNRGPGSNTALTPFVSNTVPSDNDAIVVAARIAGRIYFRNGTKLDNNDAVTTVGAGASDLRTSKIIVANSGNGDENGDFLDSGDGSQLEAALAAASSGDDIYIRPGTYDLRAGSATGPLTIPAGVRVWGAGREQVTIITKDSGDMGAFTLSDDSELWDIGIRVAVPAGAGSGATALVLLNTRSKSGRIKVDWQGSSYTATEAGNLALRAGFAVRSGTNDVRVYDPELIDLPSLRNLGVGADLVGVDAVSGVPNFRMAMAVRPVVQGGDIGINVENKMQVVDPMLQDVFSRGVLFATVGGVTMQGGTILNSSPDASYQGVRIDNGAGKIMVDGTHIIGPSTPTAGSKGMVLDADRCSVRGCNIEGYDVGIEATAQSVRNVVAATILSTNLNTAKTDAGTNNEFAHNVEA